MNWNAEWYRNANIHPASQEHQTWWIYVRGVLKGDLKKTAWNILDGHMTEFVSSTGCRFWFSDLWGMARSDLRDRNSRSSDALKNCRAWDQVCAGCCCWRPQVRMSEKMFRIVIFRWIYEASAIMIHRIKLSLQLCLHHSNSCLPTKFDWQMHMFYGCTDVRYELPLYLRSCLTSFNVIRSSNRIFLHIFDKKRQGIRALSEILLVWLDESFALFLHRSFQYLCFCFTHFHETCWSTCILVHKFLYCSQKQVLSGFTF